MSKASPSNLLLPACGLYVALLLTAFVYWPGLQGPLLLDDHENLRVLEEIPRGSLSVWDAAFTSNSGPLLRPLSMLSFAANMYLNGPDLWAFKYTNLMIHLLCGVLVFWLGGQLIKAVRPLYSPTRIWLLALAIASLWLLAPLMASTTLYVVQRMTQLAVLFSFAGLIAYTAGRQRLASRPKTGWLLILSAVAIWLPLAALSKENGLLLPLLLFVLELFVFRFSGPHRRGLGAFFMVILGLPTLLTLWVLIFSPNYFLAAGNRTFTILERTLTESRVLFFYVKNLLFPDGPQMGLFHDDYVLSKGLLAPASTLVSIAGWLALFVFALLKRKSAYSFLFFGPFFFLAGHALESTIFPLELVFEHRNYLPAFGLFFSLVLALAILIERIEAAKPLVVLLVALPFAYGFATYQRAETWSSWDRILLSAAESHPNSPRVHAELAALLSREGKLDEAIRHLETVARLQPSTRSGAALQALIAHCESAKPIPNAAYDLIPSSTAVNDAWVYTINSLRGINRLVYANRCPQLDIGKLTTKLDAWTKKPVLPGNAWNLWNVHYEVAHLLDYAGRTNEALTHLRRAQELDPRQPEAFLVMLRLQVRSRDIVAAKNTLSRLRAAFPAPDAQERRIISKYQHFIQAVDDAGGPR